MTRRLSCNSLGMYADPNGKYALYSEKDKAFMDAFREWHDAGFPISTNKEMKVIRAWRLREEERNE